jgi:dynein heavy chain, axonemal
MSTLIPRLNEEANESYEELIINENDIKEMKQEILLSVEKALEEASQYCRDFERYSYLWLEDREYCMELFLDYGRILDPDEIDMIANKDPQSPKPTPPTIEAFREMIDGYESLHTEIDQIQPVQVFNAFFQVDVRPFRQAL